MKPAAISWFGRRRKNPELEARTDPGCIRGRDFPLPRKRIDLLEELEEAPRRHDYQHPTWPRPDVPKGVWNAPRQYRRRPGSSDQLFLCPLQFQLALQNYPLERRLFRGRARCVVRIAIRGGQYG